MHRSCAKHHLQLVEGLWYTKDASKVVVCSQQHPIPSPLSRKHAFQLSAAWSSSGMYTKASHNAAQSILQEIPFKVLKPPQQGAQPETSCKQRL